MKLGKLLGLSTLLISGCLSTPPSDNPLLMPPAASTVENPILIMPGQPTPDAYAKVWNRVYSVVGDYFEIKYGNRYDGRIISFPKIAPGYERPWLNGTPDHYQRLLATLQTMQYRCFVEIRSAEQGGYMVQVTVLRELCDDPRPSNAPGAPIFRDAATVDRQLEVVEFATPPAGWIPKGRETALEDAILKKIRECQIDSIQDAR